MNTLLDLSAFGFSFVVFHDKAKKNAAGNLLGERRWHNPIWSLPKNFEAIRSLLSTKRNFLVILDQMGKREQGELKINQAGLEIVLLGHKFKS